MDWYTVDKLLHVLPIINIIGIFSVFILKQSCKHIRQWEEKCGGPLKQLEFFTVTFITCLCRRYAHKRGSNFEVSKYQNPSPAGHILYTFRTDTVQPELKCGCLPHGTARFEIHSILCPRNVHYY